MSVVLRCPTCGTTQAHLGECEACSEGEVRYFCTNHDEGIWLEGAVCSRCGAKFGDAPTAPPSSRGPRELTPPAGAPDFRAPGRDRISVSPLEPGSSRGPLTRRDREELPEPALPRRTLSLGELLEEIREGRATGSRYEGEVPWAEPGARRPGLPLAGCLARAVGLVLLLIIAAIIFLFVLFGGFLTR